MASGTLKERLAALRDSGVLLLDLRSAADFAECRIASAVNVPFDELNDRGFEVGAEEVQARPRSRTRVESACVSTT